MENIFNYPKDLTQIGGGDLSITKENNKYCLSINCNVLYPTIQKNINYFERLNNQLWKWLKTQGKAKLTEDITIKKSDIEIYKNHIGYQVCIEDKYFDDINTTYFWLKNIINNIKINYKKIEVK